MTPAVSAPGPARLAILLLAVIAVLLAQPVVAETPLDAWERIEAVKQARGCAAALSGAREALLDHPGFLPLFTQHARMRAATGGFAGARAFRDSLRAAGSLAQARTAGIFFDLDRGEAQAALDTLTTLAPAVAGSVDELFRWLDLAIAQIGSNDRDAAQQLLAAVRTHPSLPSEHRLAGRYLRIFPEQTRAVLLQRSGEVEAALAVLDAAIARAEAESLRDLSMRLHHFRGRIAADGGRPGLAIPSYETALALARELRDDWQRAGTASWLAWALEQVGNFGRSFELRMDCRELLPRMGDDAGVPYNLLGLGWSAIKVGRIKIAEDALTQAVALGEKRSWPWLHAQSLLNLGVLHLETGELERAVDVFEEGLAIAIQSGDQWQRTGFLNNLAVVHLTRVRPDRAMEIYEQLLEVHRANSDLEQESTILNNMALASEMMGQFQQAQVMFEQCLKLSEDQEFDNNNARINLGRRNSLDGNLAAGERHLREAVDAARDRGSITELSHVHAELGRCLSFQGRMSEALQHLERADSLRSERGLMGIRVPDLIRLALVHFALQEWDEALATLSKAQVSAERHAPTQIPTIHTLRAFTLLELGKTDAARREARAAERSTWRSTITDRSSEWYVRQVASGGAIHALLRSTRTGGSIDASAITRESFEMLQRAKSRTLLEYVQGGQRSIEPDVPDSLVRGERAVRLTIDRVRRSLDEAAGSVALDSLRLALAEAQAVHERIRSLIFREDRRYRDVSTPAQFDSVALEEIVGQRTLVLDYLISRNCEPWLDCEATLFVADADSIEAFTIGDTRELSRQTDLLLDLLERAPGSGDDSVDLLLRELGHALLEPVADRLERYDEIVIVPDGKLQGLPFAALILPKDHRSDADTYLVQVAAIQVVPSLPVLHQLREGAEYSPEGAKAWDIAVWPGPRGLTESTSGLDLDLPHADQELDALLERFPRAAVLELALRPEPALHAQLGELAPLGASKILHFIAHGFFDDLQPWRSGLYLGAVEGDEEPAKLEIADVYHLDLRSSLVTLSACETARGGTADHVGFVGFTQALFGSGASSVLATLWPIDDASTPYFMANFYERLGEGHSKSEALRRAQLGFLREDSLDHPFYWAPYVLLGDGSGYIDLDLAPSSTSSPPWASLLAGAALLFLAMGSWRRDTRV